VLIILIIWFVSDWHGYMLIGQFIALELGHRQQYHKSHIINCLLKPCLGLYLRIAASDLSGVLF